jgi:hypothetical protein
MLDVGVTPLLQVKTSLLTWVTRDCTSLQLPLPAFLRNKVAQTLVAVLQVGASSSSSRGSMPLALNCLTNSSSWSCSSYVLKPSTPHARRCWKHAWRGLALGVHHDQPQQKQSSFTVNHKESTGTGVAEGRLAGQRGVEALVSHHGLLLRVGAHPPCYAPRV